MDHLQLQTQTAYAELLELLTAIEARRAIGHTGGSFVLKTVKGQEYYYHQHAEPGGIVQRYVGRRTTMLDRVVARFTEGRSQVLDERQVTDRLCSVLRAGGALAFDTAGLRVLSALADAAVFRLGGVLVGTYAFIALGNALGVRWASAALRTEDLDIASQRTLAVAVPRLRADVPKILDSLEMGFLPVPGLSPRDPSTSFKVRGRALRVDLLTPQSRGARKPVMIPRFAAAAQPLPYLDYLIEETLSAAAIGATAVLLTVPLPGRFALHKLVTMHARSASLQTKSQKDLHQAAQVIEFLAADRPGDLRQAWEGLVRRRWKKAIHSGLESLKRRFPDAHAALEREIA